MPPQAGELPTLPPQTGSVPTNPPQFGTLPTLPPQSGAVPTNPPAITLRTEELNDDTDSPTSFPTTNWPTIPI